MAIRHLRILSVDHLEPGQPAREKAGPALSEPGGDYEALAAQFKRLFNSKPGKAYGQFSMDLGEHPFSAWLKDYVEEKQGFESFSQRVLGQWAELISSGQVEYAGHLLLVHEALADGEVFYLYGLETDSAFFVNRNLELDAQDVLSLSRLNLAVRIELADWLSATPAENYLTAFKGRGTGDLGDAFLKLIGFHNNVDVDQETRTFLDAVEAFAREVDDDQAQNVRTRAYDFCREQNLLGEPVAMEALSGYIDEAQPERFAQFISESGALPEETVLHPDHRKVRKLVRIAGKGNGMSLSFSSDLMNRAIRYDREQDALVITQLPKGLKQQLQQFLEQPGDSEG